MVAIAVALLAIVLAWPVPRLLPRLASLRRVPGPGLLLWQAVSLAAVFCGLAAAPLAMLDRARASTGPISGNDACILIIGVSVTGVIVVRLLLQAHRTGTTLRRTRREHQQLVDVLGDDVSGGPVPVRVLPHPTPTAYCVPGRHARVVLTDATMRSLPDGELSAVLAHERAHLRYRHDLVLEFFTVLHSAVPPWVRSPAGLREVTLLIEVLADHVALQSHSPRELGRALLAIADGPHPGATLGATDSALTRMRLLQDRRPHHRLALTAVLASLLVLLVPILLITAGILGLAP